MKPRLTLAGWIVVGVLALLAVGILLIVGRALWGSTLYTLPRVDVEPTGNPEPTPLPWASRMHQIGKDVWMVPEEVRLEILAQYAEALNWQMPVSPTFDLDAIAREAPTYLTGVYLEQTMEALDATRKICTSAGPATPDYPLAYVAVQELSVGFPGMAVIGCSADGAECTVEVQWDGTEPFAVYNFCTGQWLGQGHMAPAIQRFRMRYVAGRWKIAELLFQQVMDTEHQFERLTPTPGPTPTLVPLATPLP